MQKVTTILFLCFVSLLFAATLTAQDAGASDQTLLPEIDPQDIEIRSQFQARFPGLRRQPILGFNPRPRVFQIDPDRQPFIEDEETVMANLPLGQLDRPEAPVYMPLGYANPRNGFARVGVGSYFTPEADIYAIARIRDGNWVSGNVRHLSTDGHVEDATSSYRDFDANFNLFNSFSKRTKLRSHFGFKSNFNHYPGLVTDDEGPTDLNTRVEQAGFRGGTDLTVARTSISGVDFGVSGYAYRYDLTSNLDNYVGDVNEWGFRGRAEYSRLGSNVEEVHRVRVASEAGGIETLDNGMGGWSVTRVSAHYERLFNYQTEVKASMGLAGVTDAVNGFTFHVAPDVQISHTLLQGIELRGQVRGTPSHNSLNRVHNMNRFIDFTTPFEHQFTWEAKAEAVLEPFRGSRLTGGVSYQNIFNHLYFTQNSNEIAGTGLTEQYFTPTFNDANIFRVYGSFSQDLRPDVLWIKADGHWQRPRLTGNDKIPFTETFALKGTASFRPVGQLVVEGWAEYAGNREDSFGQSLSSYIVMGSRFEISVTERLGVYGKILNILDEEYELWRGYPERGFQGYVGITYLF
ncbi:MAG: hypothetical protein JJU46_02875 [Balneolaceae bacterium]|nr:hypothetical protein [Balneolaceae bacterium]MCH8548412.1 hypothetical protein [Balneolaceae bacterium]